MNRPSVVGVHPAHPASPAPPEPPDVGGLLAAHADIAPTTSGAVLTVTVDAPWRASEIVHLLAAAGVAASTTDGPGGIRVRTEPASSLVAVAADWYRDGSKNVPDEWVPGPGALRLWYIAAGHMEVDGQRYVLGLDPEVPTMSAALVRALIRAGIAPTLVSPHDGRPGLRVSGRRRLAHLAEHLGDPPDDPDARAIWPHEEHPERHM